MLRVIVIILTLITTPTYGQQCDQNDLCSVYRCPDGMICSTSDQQCVCANNASYAGQTSIYLSATVFDFLQNNTDFENGEPDRVLVDNVLGDENIPVFINNSRFDTWFRPAPGINCQVNVTLTISDRGDGVYILDGLNYFPIDNQGWGNEGNPHNYHFSTKTSWTVDYQGGEYMYLRFDDGLLVYLNRYLIVNEPELHYNGLKRLQIDDIAGNAGIIPGNSYSLHVFHVERHTIESILYLETNLTVHPPTCPRLCETDNDCHYGLCHTFEKVCHCQQGWGGNHCDQELCWNVDCGAHGTCNSYTGECTCHRKWTGDRCEVKKCNYHGTPHANAPNKCDCDPYFTGDDCDECIPGNGIRRNICRKNGDGKFELATCHQNNFKELVSESEYARPGNDDLDCICRQRRSSSDNTEHDESTFAYYDRRVESLRNGLDVGTIDAVDDTSGSLRIEAAIGLILVAILLFETI